MSRIILAPLLASLALLLTACATPQAALDQANVTASLATSFDVELATYRKAAARVAAARLASIRRQEALIAQLAEVDVWNARTAGLAGLGDAEDMRRSLVTLAASRESDEAATRQRLAELDAQLAAVVTPLPSTSAKLAALKSALAEMGIELPASERIKLALDAVQTVREEVQKNHAATSDAQAKTATAPVPSSPPPKDAQP